MCEKIASQFSHELNTVLPVSAGLARALQTLGQQPGAWTRLLATLQRIPPARLAMLLSNAELFCDEEFVDCPVPPVERQALLGAMPWSVFRTIARVAGEQDFDPSAVYAHLRDMAGFDQLTTTLEQHFFQRGHILRCHRIVDDARTVLDAVKYRHLPACRQHDRDDMARRERFLRFIRQAPGDRTTARELEELVSSQLDVVGRAQALETLQIDLDRDLAQLSRALTEHNAGYVALQLLEEHSESFTPAEVDELRALLGLHGLDIAQRLAPGKVTVAFVQERQIAWRAKELVARETSVRFIVKRAQSRYGLLLDMMIPRG